MTEPSVAAAVVTYNRRDVLRRSLAGLMAQRRPPDEIVVIDNASTDGTADMVAAEFPGVQVVRMAENTGAAGGFAAGLREGVARGHDWIWMFNDDDIPQPDALASLLDAEWALPPRTGMVGCARGGDDEGPIALGLRWQRHHGRVVTADPDDPPVPVDVLAFSCTLIAAALVADIGVPKAEYFIMIEEPEYCLRARRAGWNIYVVPQPLVVSLNLGSVAGQSLPWRGYYQTRNQLAMALEHRSVPEVWWWAVRNAKFAVGALRAGDHRAERLRLRALGAWHGLRGISGRTVQPRVPATTSTAGS